MNVHKTILHVLENRRGPFIGYLRPIFIGPKAGLQSMPPKDFSRLRLKSSRGYPVKAVFSSRPPKAPPLSPQ